MEELSHRVKNTLAVVQAIASQSLSGSKSFAEANEALTSRLRALSDAHDALVHGSWRATPVRLLVGNAARLHADDSPERFRISGPDVTLGPRGALSLALVLHELATNAVKHGGLSTAAGHVDVSWSVDNSGQEPRFRLRWQERNGPPVTVPARTGFGTRLISRSLGSDFAATADLAYRPDGVVFDLDASLSALQQP